MRTCKKCFLTLVEDCFYPKYGSCKECIKLAVAKWKKANPERAKAFQLKHNTTAKAKLARRLWNERNPDKRKAIARKYAASEKGKISGAKARSSPAFKAWSKAYSKSRYSISLAQQKKRRHSDINFRIRCNLRSRIRCFVTGRSTDQKTLALLGCTLASFRIYIESKFKSGMSWDNYGEWEIDHIMPCAIFDLSKIDHQRRCFHFSNLRPLWKAENRRKGKKITDPQFSICLST